jgi:hypothetical protein
MFELLAQNFALAGGLLATLPIFLHLLRRTPAVRAPFSVVRFLTPVLPVTTRRSRLQHWPLMLLRMLAVVLIGLAFSRPFQRQTIQQTATDSAGRRIAILLDGSASMRRDGLREALQTTLKQIADDLQPDDLVSITRYSSVSQPLVTASEWQQADPGSRQTLIDRAIESYEPDWQSTNTGKAMLEAAEEIARERLATSDRSERRVIVITDFQEGSQLDALRSGSWPDNVTSDLRIVSPTQQGNAGLSLAEDRRTGRIRVRLTNAGDASVGQYQLQPFDTTGQPLGAAITADVAPGQRRTLTLPDTPEDTPLIAGVELLGDVHPFDNVVDLPVAEKQVRRIAHAGSTDANNPELMRYYLQRVLDGDDTEAVQVLDLLPPESPPIAPPADVRLVVVTDTVPAALADALRSFVDRGGVLLMALSSVEMANSVRSLFPDLADVKEAAVTDYAMLTSPDLTSSLLAPFANAQFADFSSIRIWHHRVLTLKEPASGLRVLAQFDSGSPAILEAPQAAGGRIFVLATGWHPADSQWALSSRFPPMISRLLRLAHPEQGRDRLFDVGTTLNPGDLLAGSSWTLKNPEGGTQNSGTPTNAAEPVAGAENARPTQTTAGLQSVSLDRPGRWTLTAETPDGPQSMDFLVTVAASESRTEPLPYGQLQAMGLTSATVINANQVQANPEDAQQMDAVELESQQKFWRFLLIAGLCCLIAEAILTRFLEKRQNMVPVG